MKHVTGPNSRTKLTNVQEQDPQPNACDVRLGKVFLIRPKVFIISEEEKVHRGSVEISPDAAGWYSLPVGSYEVVAENEISVGEGEAGWIVSRSTLNRNGVFITSGIYDSNYSGICAMVMHVTTGPLKIKRGTRIGQYVSFEAEMLHAYNGSYGFGTEDDAKYGTSTVAEIQEPQLPLEPPIKRVRITDGTTIKVVPQQVWLDDYPTWVKASPGRSKTDGN